ncbi:MAG: aromatic ring-hydroxylating dioxygenase subunit alpha [Myxococcota bacterium]
MSLSEQLLSGKTIPGHWYTSQEIFDSEQKYIFSKMWNYAGSAHLLRNPGDYITCRVAGKVPVIVVRTEAGSLNAFVNVCRHRGSQIVLCESGNRKSIQCHYHAWTWNLQGDLQSAPATNSDPKFMKSNYPLHPLTVEEWGPFVFVSLLEAPQSFASQMDGLPEAISEIGIDLMSLKHHRQMRYEIHANWKLTIDNYLECYHCPVAHPELVKIVRMDDYEVTPYAYHSVQRCTLKGAEMADADKKLRGAGSYLWPNFTINIYPGIVNVSSTVYEPISPNKTLAIYDIYFPEGVTESDKDSVVDFLDQVQKEDTALCEAVQRGCASGYYEQGQLVLAKENGVQHFQRLVHDALAA